MISYRILIVGLALMSLNCLCQETSMLLIRRGIGDCLRISGSRDKDTNGVWVCAKNAPAATPPPIKTIVRANTNEILTSDTDGDSIALNGTMGVRSIISGVIDKKDIEYSYRFSPIFSKVKEDTILIYKTDSLVVTRINNEFQTTAKFSPMFLILKEWESFEADAITVFTDKQMALDQSYGLEKMRSELSPYKLCYFVSRKIKELGSSKEIFDTLLKIDNRELSSAGISMILYSQPSAEVKAMVESTLTMSHDPKTIESVALALFVARDLKPGKNDREWIDKCFVSLHDRMSREPINSQFVQDIFVIDGTKYKKQKTIEK